jgi:hypothetical protein
MFVTVTAVLCHLAAPTLCVEEIVTDTNMDDTLTMQSCLMGQAYLAKYMAEHPIYRTGYRLDRWRCTIGNREPPPPGGRA